MAIEENVESMKVLGKTLRIIEDLDVSGPSELGAIADRTDLPRSTVHHHLNALEDGEYVVNNNGVYRLSMRFLDVGEQVRRRKALFRIARSEIDELADRTGRPITLFLSEHGDAVVLYTRGENPTIPVTTYPGQRFSLHATAAGKALLSTCDDSFGDNGLRDDDLSSFTAQTITNQEELARTLQDVTKKGYAISQEERWEGRCSVAVPLAPKGDISCAAIETAFTPDQFQNVDRGELAEELEQTANVISIKSNYSS